MFCALSSGVARTFPGGRVALPEDQIEEENEQKLRKKEKLGNVPLLPTRGWESIYAPGSIS